MPRKQENPFVTRELNNLLLLKNKAIVFIVVIKKQWYFYDPSNSTVPVPLPKHIKTISEFLQLANNSGALNKNINYIRAILSEINNAELRQLIEHTIIEGEDWTDVSESEEIELEKHVSFESIENDENGRESKNE